MGHSKYLASISAAIIPLFLISSHKAYLDPGTGSIIIQLLIGVIVGGLVSVRIFWSKIRARFKGSFQQGKKHEGSKR
jgi:hypothetical protein